MWIRSQDGKKIIDVNQVVMEGRKVVCNKWVLGEYTSEAAAIGVMDIIEGEINSMHNGTEEFAVFQMPEEKEKGPCKAATLTKSSKANK